MGVILGGVGEFWLLLLSVRRDERVNAVLRPSNPPPKIMICFCFVGEVVDVSSTDEEEDEMVVVDVLIVRFIDCCLDVWRCVVWVQIL